MLLIMVRIGVLIRLYWICRLRIGGCGLRWGYLLMRGLIWNGIYCLSLMRRVVIHKREIINRFWSLGLMYDFVIQSWILRMKVIGLVAVGLRYSISY
jgi:hypothetical protein